MTEKELSPLMYLSPEFLAIPFRVRRFSDKRLVELFNRRLLIRVQQVRGLAYEVPTGQVSFAASAYSDTFLLEAME